MPEYTLSHRYSEYTAGSDPSTFSTHLKDEAVLAGWTLISTGGTGDFTIESAAESVNHDKLRVRIWSGLDGSNPCVRYNVLKPWASGFTNRVFCLDGWVMACSISKYQMCWMKKTNDGSHAGRYGYLGILKKPAFYESVYYPNGSAISALRETDSENWRSGSWYSWSHNAENFVSKSRGYIVNASVNLSRMVLPYLSFAQKWAVSNDWVILEPDIFVSSHPMGQSGILHGRLFDSFVIAGTYNAGDMIVYDSKDWIALTHQASSGMTLFFLAENF